jgi:hypothetical protein
MVSIMNGTLTSCEEIRTKVGVDEHIVRRYQGRVVLEEHMAGNLRRLADELPAHCLLLCLLFGQGFGLGLIRFQPVVAFADNSLDLE